MTHPTIARPRAVRLRVPVRFDGATSATLTIDRARSILTIRLLRRRSTLEVALGPVVERLLRAEAFRKADEKRKARRRAR